MINATVIRKPQPHPKATNLKCRLLIKTLAKKKGTEKNNSDAIKSIIAITENQIATSSSDKGKFIQSQP